MRVQVCVGGPDLSESGHEGLSGVVEGGDDEAIGDEHNFSK